MDYEKKLALAKEALDSGSYDKETIEYIFPELKESEDERIRKALISTFQNRKKYCIADTFGEVSVEDAIAWLEKQGKNNMGISEATKKKLEDNLNKALEKETPDSWNEFLEKQGEQKPAYTKEYDFHGMKFVPKFAKGDIIKDKKRSEVSIIKDFSYDTGLYTHTYGQFPITIQDNYEIIEQKPAWSEQDEKIYNLLYEEYKNIAYYSHSREKAEDIPGEVLGWLKSIKDRVQPQPKQEWNEKDETALGDALWCCKQAASIAKNENDMGNVLYAENWLKSLRERYTWKPSDEQIKACKEVYADVLSAKGFDVGTINSELNRLEEQMKKLKDK